MLKKKAKELVKEKKIYFYNLSEDNQMKMKDDVLKKVDQGIVYITPNQGRTMV